MKTAYATVLYKKQRIIKHVLAMVLLCSSIASYAQIDPTDSLPGDPGAMSVYTVQNLSFGAFSSTNSGGTIVVSSSGTRSVSGNVIALNLGTPFFQAIFDVDTPVGTIVSILNGPDATLTGSNGGSMSVHIGASDPQSPFITVVNQPSRTPVKIGGTLTVGSAPANPPGTYNGTIYIIFNHE